MQHHPLHFSRGCTKLHQNFSKWQKCDPLNSNESEIYYVDIYTWLFYHFVYCFHVEHTFHFKNNLLHYSLQKNDENDQMNAKRGFIISFCTPPYIPLTYTLLTFLVLYKMAIILKLCVAKRKAVAVCSSSFLLFFVLSGGKK